MQARQSIRVVVVSDGKRGHENQSRVVARMIGDAAPLLMLLRDSIKEGGGLELLLRLHFALLGRRSVSQRQAADLTRVLMRPEHPDEFREFAVQLSSARVRPEPALDDPARELMNLFVVSTGTPAATLNLLLTRLLGGKSVVCMTPSLLPRSRFDLNIVPEHDLGVGQVRSQNLLATPLALGHHDQPSAQLLAQQLCRDHRLDQQEAYIGLAVGGPSRSAPWDGELLHAALAALHDACSERGLRLLVTTSRRTPAATLDFLRRWQGGQVLAYLLDASSDPLNPLPAFYELARAMAVTADSFSMASEALHAGHGPLLLPVNAVPPRGRLKRGLDLLTDNGLAIPARYAGEIERFVDAPPERGPVNAIYDELATSVRRRLGLTPK